MRRPKPHPFLGAEAGRPTPDADVLVWGVAADGGVSFRGGAAGGPEGIRRFSDSIETWSPRHGRDLEDLRIVDAGDHVSMETAESAAAKLLDATWTGEHGPLLVTLGGDHSITPPIVRAMAARCPSLAVVGFDAHLDLRASYQGEHACTFRRLADAGLDCFVFGLRSGERREWEEAPKLLRHHSQDLRVPAAVLRKLQGRPVYLTVDIDVLDPSEAPGTGTPEAGGFSYAELLGAIDSLYGLNVVAFDVVEVAPPLDPSGITQAAAAKLVREIVLRFAS